MGLVVRVLIFTILVPGSITVGVPYLLLSRSLELFSFEIGYLRGLGVVPIALGAAVYIWCAWDFAVAGKGTPAPWDPPRILATTLKKKFAAAYEEYCGTVPRWIPRMRRGRSQG